MRVGELSVERALKCALEHPKGTHTHNVIHTHEERERGREKVRGKLLCWQYTESSVRVQHTYTRRIFLSFSSTAVRIEMILPSTFLGPSLHP